MYIKFLKHGKGDAAKAASYLIDDVDHLNRPRPDVQILRGDPQTFTAIAESIQNDWIYTSGVIAWSVEDKPTDDDINEVLDAFECHAFAGLEPHQYHFTAVLHEEDDGSKHVHFLVPRVELETGKALNIAPPNHESYFDPLRDYFNYQKGWSRPDDPSIKRDTQTPDHIVFQDKFAVRAGLKGKSVNGVRELVGSYLEQRIEQGFIRNREDVLDAVSELGTVTRKSDEFISLKIDGAEKAIRLKGSFYESEFNIKSYLENRKRKENDARASREHRVISPEHRGLADECREKLEKLAGKRELYNRGRYETTLLSPTANTEFDRFFEPTVEKNHSIGRPVYSPKQNQPRNSSNSSIKEAPLYLDNNFSFDNSYFASKQPFFGLSEQEQTQRNSRERGAFAENRIGDRGADSGVRKNDGVNLDFESRKEEMKNEIRSRVIKDCRRTALKATEILGNVGVEVEDYSGTGALYQKLGAISRAISGEACRTGKGNSDLERSEELRGSFKRFETELFSENREAIDFFSEQLKHRDQSRGRSRGRSGSLATATIADFGSRGNQQTVAPLDGGSSRKNDLLGALSRGTKTLDFSNVQMVLNKLEASRQNQYVNAKNYDSPSPF